MKREQRNFTFKRQFLFSFPRPHVIPRAISFAKERLLQSGYLSREYVVIGTSIRCYAARANVPLKERRRLQTEFVDSA